MEKFSLTKSDVLQAVAELKRPGESKSPSVVLSRELGISYAAVQQYPDDREVPVRWQLYLHLHRQDVIHRVATIQAARQAAADQPVTDTKTSEDGGATDTPASPSPRRSATASPKGGAVSSFCDSAGLG